MDQVELRRWVSARLHDVLGYSESSTVRYVVSLAQESRSQDELVRRLDELEMDTKFASELWRRSHGAFVEKKERKRDQANEDEDEEETRIRLAQISKRQRMRTNNEQRVQSKSVGSDEDAKKREDDVRERDALAARIRERDEQRTRLMVREGGLSKEQVEALTQRGAFGVTANENQEEQDVATMRKVSRQAYLNKWEAKQLDLLEAEVNEEKVLFAEEKLTEEEIRHTQLSEQIIKMARDRQRFVRGDEGYRLPDAYEERMTTEKLSQNKTLAAAREEVLSKRYHEEAEPKTEQELWDEAQTGRAKQIQSKKKSRYDVDDSDYIFEDHIDFVRSKMMLKGIDNIKKGKNKDLLLFQDDDVQQPEKRIVSRGEERQRAKEKLDETRKKLPAYAFREEFLAAVADNQILIVIGETGSGKTTQLPQYLHEVGYSKLGIIGCTQPRRVAAMSVAARVSTEVGCSLGREVGYSIRFEDCTSKDTLIKYMTDGMLLREFLGEPDLASYAVMMVDEAHERTLHTDVLFGLIKDVARFRDDIKIIISSATMNADAFSIYFDDAAIFNIPGRTYDVEILYTKAPEADYLDAAVVTILQTHITQPFPGDVLVFFTGQEEIEAAVEILMERTKALGSRIKELIICPIYASLPSEQQAKIFEPTPEGARKVVIGTNIAETSLTIDGICYVIDTGFCKQKTYNPRTGVESLIVTPISQAQAAQRAGRAGRTQPGTCFRLYTAWAYQHELDENTIPEIQRTNMTSVVLMLKSLGIHDLLHFDFMDPPPAEMLVRALEQLYALGALNDRGELTKMGRRMAEFPCDPQLAKSIIIADKHTCVEQVITIGAMLSAGNSIFFRPKERAVHADNAKLNFARGGGGDHATLLRVYTEWSDADYSTQWCFENYIQAKSMMRARDIKDQFALLCERVELEVSSSQDIDHYSKAFCAGYFYHAAKLASTGEYKTVKHLHTVYIHPSSVLSQEDVMPAWLCYHELAFTTKEYMRMVFPIQSNWLIEVAPHYYQQKEIQDPRKHKMPKSGTGLASVAAAPSSSASA